jgi:hypothetical protein
MASRIGGMLKADTIELALIAVVLGVYAAAA